MRAEEQLDQTDPTNRYLQAALARMAWAAAPTVRLFYVPEDDTLVAEIVEADAVVDTVVAERLLVEFDGADDGALPTTVYLTGVCSDAPAIAVARDVLGEPVWATAMALVAGGSTRADLVLDADEVVARRARWRGLADRPRERSGPLAVQVGGGDRLVGVEVLHDSVHAVLTEGAATVLDSAGAGLDRNDEATVVQTIARLVGALAERHPGTAAATCPIGVQIGGPVDTSTGIVTFYDKPNHDRDEPWKDVPLGALVRAATGRRVEVFNDAAALAAHEVACGFGTQPAAFAVLLISQGIGARLVRDGLVESYPMEIGMFVPEPGAGYRSTPPRRKASIEARNGVRAIVDAVNNLVREPVTTLNQAAEVAGRSPLALDVFGRAGAGLARAVAAIQAIVNPEAWAVFGPPELLDGSTRPGRAFLSGLQTASDYLDYAGLWPPKFFPRPLTGHLGARAAAAALIQRSPVTVVAPHRPVGPPAGGCMYR